MLALTCGRSLGCANEDSFVVLVIYLGMVQVHAVHGQLFGIFQEVHLCGGWRHPPLTEQTDQSQQGGVSLAAMSSHPDRRHDSQ